MAETRYAPGLKNGSGVLASPPLFENVWEILVKLNYKKLGGVLFHLVT
jgi:hypothetical protein